MQADELTAERLAQLLREAEHAHGEYERGLGHRDDERAAWHARYIVEKLGEE